MIKNPPRQGRFFTALLRRAASAAFDAGSPCVGRLESIKSKGAPAKSAILWGTPVRHGGPPPGRLCAGEMNMIKNPPRQGRFFTALLRRAASAAFDAGSPCVGRLESIKSKGAPAKSAILWGTPLRHGGSAKRRFRAGEMKMIKNPPRQGRFFARQAEPRNPIPQSASPPAPFTQGSLTGALSPSPVGGPGGTFLLPVEH